MRIIPALCDASILRYNADSRHLVGIIQDKKQNVLHVYDEADKHTDRLYYLFDDDAWHVGDRVSVDYSLDTHVIQRIKRMTPVQYNKEGKNCGFIHGRPI